MASVAYNSGNYPVAIIILADLSRHDQAVNDREALPLTRLKNDNLIIVFMRLKQTDSSAYYINEGLSVARHENLAGQIIQFNKTSVEAYSVNHSQDEVKKYYDELEIVNDSIFSIIHDKQREFVEAA